MNYFKIIFFQKWSYCIFRLFSLLLLFSLSAGVAVKAKNLGQEANMKADHFKNSAFVKYAGDYFQFAANLTWI